MKKRFFKKGLVALCVAALLCTFASCGEKKENSSEAASEATSVESTVDTSATSEEATSEDASAEASEDASVEVSEEASAEVSEEVSEEVSVEVPEEFKDNKGIVAVIGMETELESMEKGKLIMAGKVEIDAKIINEFLPEEISKLITINAKTYMENKIEIYVDNTGAERKAYNRLTKTMYVEVAGAKVWEDVTVEDSLVIGNVEYVFDNETKTYTTREPEKLLDIEEIKSVETKEEVYDGKTYVVDTITFFDDTTLDVYTEDGEIAYFETAVPVSSENIDCKLAVEMDHDNSGVSFEIPEGYTAA